MTTRRNNSLLASCIVACGLMMSSGVAVGADSLTLITEDYPPLNYVENKQLKGPSVDIVEAIKQRLGVTGKIKVYPWARGYRFLETKKNTALFSTARTAAREELFKWVGPIAEKKIGLFAKRERNIKLESLKDARGYLIGVQRDSVTMQYLVEHGFMNFDASTSSDANLKKLMGGRNDLWFSSNATAAGTSERLNISLNELELVLEIDNTFIYIAFNSETPDSIIREWQDAFDALVAEGAVTAIFQAHELETLRPTFAGD